MTVLVNEGRAAADAAANAVSPRKFHYIDLDYAGVLTLSWG